MRQNRPFEVCSSFTSWPGHLLECDLGLLFDFSTPTGMIPAIRAFLSSGCNFINQSESGARSGMWKECQRTYGLRGAGAGFELRAQRAGYGPVGSTV